MVNNIKSNKKIKLSIILLGILTFICISAQFLGFSFVPFGEFIINNTFISFGGYTNIVTCDEIMERSKLDEIFSNHRSELDKFIEDLKLTENISDSSVPNYQYSSYCNIKNPKPPIIFEVNSDFEKNKIISKFGYDFYGIQFSIVNI